MARYDKATELEVPRAEIEVTLGAKRQAEASALTQLETAKAKVALALATSEQFQKPPGLRGKVVCWLAKSCNKILEYTRKFVRYFRIILRRKLFHMAINQIKICLCFH